MAEDLGNGLLLVTQEDDVDLEDGPDGQVIHDSVPALVVQVTEQVQTIVEEPQSISMTTTDEVVNLVEAPDAEVVTEIVLGPQGAQGLKGDTGEKGDKGDPGEDGDKTFVYDQQVPAATWVVDHDLGKHPSVTIRDSAGGVVIGDVFYDSNSRVTISFTAPFSGVVYLN